MLILPSVPSRDDVLSFLAGASSYGNLGIFVGAGFSKAVLNEEKVIALSWGELLERAATRMDVDYPALSKTGLSYPEVASSLCNAHSIATAGEYGKSLKHLKRILADLTCWYPTGAQQDKYAAHLSTLEPAWIITTNYDLVIESLLTGKSVPLGPNDSLSAQRGVIPVFHLHGIRTNPDEIIIAQEDYVSLFRSNQYRQIKLALTIKESTTLFIGYGLGDVNVLTALDWSRNVFIAEQRSYPNDVIQVVQKNDPSSDPYRDRNDIVILETASIDSFFEEFSSVRDKLAKIEAREQKKLTQLAKELDSPDDSLIEKFIDDEDFRRSMLKVLSKFSIHLASGFISFLDRCINETWSRSAPHGAFGGYKQNLAIILDILVAFPMDRFPPAIFQSAAYGLDRVSHFVGKSRGQSWAAATLWNSRKAELTTDVVRELLNVAEQYGYAQLNQLLGEISSEL